MWRTSKLIYHLLAAGAAPWASSIIDLWHRWEPDRHKWHLVFRLVHWGPGGHTHGLSHGHAMPVFRSHDPCSFLEDFHFSSLGCLAWAGNLSTLLTLLQDSICRCFEQPLLSCHLGIRPGFNSLKSSQGYSQGYKWLEGVEHLQRWRIYLLFLDPETSSFDQNTIIRSLNHYFIVGVESNPAEHEGWAGEGNGGGAGWRGETTIKTHHKDSVNTSSEYPEPQKPIHPRSSLTPAQRLAPLYLEESTLPARFWLSTVKGLAVILM